jgi:two-component system, cell cycle sensor histidine kinase and response regulator CckA
MTDRTAQDGYEQEIAGFLRSIAEANARASALRMQREQEGAEGGAIEPALAELDVALEELHTAEEELRAQNEELVAAKDQIETERQRYLELFRDAPLAYLVTDLEGVILEANRAATDLMRRPVRFLRGKPIAIFAPEAERAGLRDLMYDLVHQEPRRRRAEVILSPSGSPHFPVLIIADLIPGRASRPSTIRWMLVDQLQALSGVQTITGWESRILAALRDPDEEAIVAVDGDNKVVWWNRAAELMLGHTAPDVLGKPCPINPLISDDPQTVYRKDGRTVGVSVRHTALLGLGAPDGHLYRLRRYRPDRRNRVESLGNVVAARLAAGLAHHLNNIMQVVVSGTDLVRRDTSDLVQVAKDLTAIKEAAFRAAAITRSLVQYTGQEVTWPRAVALNEVLERAVSMLELPLPDAVDLGLVLDPASPQVNVDVDIMSRALHELLSHAFRTLQPNGRVVVETVDLGPRTRNVRGDDPADGYVRLSIYDNGPGMTEDARAHLFEPFSTFDPESFDPEKNAVGMGLSMAWGSVLSAGGFIRVESRPGFGSTLSVFLPRIALPPVSAPPHGSS